jgi:hypothetical protein
MGYSRDSFYGFKELYDKGGEAALQRSRAASRCSRTGRKPEIEQTVVEFALEQPACGQVPGRQ